MDVPSLPVPLPFLVMWSVARVLANTNDRSASARASSLTSQYFMATPLTPESYFEFTGHWLAQQPQRSRDAKQRHQRKDAREVSEQLAAQTCRRIRAARVDWQRLRWRTRHKVTNAVQALQPSFHAEGLHKFVAQTYPDHRLTLAHTLGDRLRLQATLAFLNHRVDSKLSPRCYGSRPYGTRNCTDRRTAVRRFHRLVWTEGNIWVAKLDVKKFYDTLPHEPVLAALKSLVNDRGCYREIEGYLAWYWSQCWQGHASLPTSPVGLPQGSPVSAVLANIYMTSFDKTLTANGIEHIRFLDDVTILAQSPEQLAERLDFAMQRIEALGLTLASEKTRVACLGVGREAGGSPPTTLTLPMRGDRLPVHREFDELGVHFYADGQFRARHRTVNRLLSKARWEIRRDRKTRSPIARYLRATATINLMLGYKVSFLKPKVWQSSLKRKSSKPRSATQVASRRARVRRQTSKSRVKFKKRSDKPVAGVCWISGARYIQPRQHALLGHSDLTMAQMHRVDRTIQRWMRQEFRKAIMAAPISQDRRKHLLGRRVRSAAKMFEMAAREPVPKCPRDPLADGHDSR